MNDIEEGFLLLTLNKVLVIDERLDVIQSAVGSKEVISKGA